MLERSGSKIETGDKEIGDMEWIVSVYRDDEELSGNLVKLCTVQVVAPNWLTAENIALRDAAEDFGGDMYDYSASTLRVG